LPHPAARHADSPPQPSGVLSDTEIINDRAERLTSIGAAVHVASTALAYVESSREMVVSVMIDLAEAAALLDTLWGRTEAVVNEPDAWHAVDALVTAPLEERHLDRGRTRRIMECS